MGKKYSRGTTAQAPHYSAPQNKPWFHGPHGSFNTQISLILDDNAYQNLQHEHYMQSASYAQV